MKIAASLLVILALAAALPTLALQTGPDDFLRKAQLEREKAEAEKRFKELKQAALELASVSKELSEEVEKSSEHVISARVFDRLGKIEELTKRIKDRAKGY